MNTDKKRMVVLILLSAALKNAVYGEWDGAGGAGGQRVASISSTALEATPGISAIRVSQLRVPRASSEICVPSMVVALAGDPSSTMMESAVTSISAEC
jgi:hypothetical protein